MSLPPTELLDMALGQEGLWCTTCPSPWQERGELKERHPDFKRLQGEGASKELSVPPWGGESSSVLLAE